MLEAVSWYQVNTRLLFCVKIAHKLNLGIFPVQAIRLSLSTVPSWTEISGRTCLS